MNTLDDILATKLNETVPGFGAAVKVKKDSYASLIQHRNLSTYSTQEIFHACPRKYMWKKLQAHIGTGERTNSPTFAFGHAVGAGVADFDKHCDLRSAIWQAFLAWDIDLFAEEREGNANGKSFWEAIWALYEYRTFFNEETDLADYEVIEIEATLLVDLEDGHYYSGHIDELLRHRESGRLRVKENKTTAKTVVDPVLYSNSDQALSYAIVVDMVGSNEYSVLYTVYSSGAQRWMQFEFPKSALQKADWLQDQILTSNQIERYSALNFFPKRGASCFSYRRRCEYYETCDMSPQHTVGITFANLPTIESKEQVEAIEHVDFFTTLSEIVSRQREKLQGVE